MNGRTKKFVRLKLWKRSFISFRMITRLGCGTRLTRSGFTSQTDAVHENMPSPGEPLDLIDLKFLPAWVKEDWSAARHAGFEGEEVQAHWSHEGTDRHPRPPRHRPGDEKNRRRRDRENRDDRKPLDRKDRKHSHDFQARRQAPKP